MLACAPLSGTQVSLSFFDTGIACYITQSPHPLNLLGRGTMGVRWHKIVTFNLLISIVPKSIVKLMTFLCPLAPPLSPLKVYPNSSRGVGWHDPIIFYQKYPEIYDDKMEAQRIPALSLCLDLNELNQP